MCPALSKIYQIINIFRMMFVYHYVIIPLILKNAYKKIAKYSSLSIMEVKPFPFIIPFHPQYLSKHAPLILQGGGIQRGVIRCSRTLKFSLLVCNSFRFKDSL